MYHKCVDIYNKMVGMSDDFFSFIVLEGPLRNVIPTATGLMLVSLF